MYGHIELGCALKHMWKRTEIHRTSLLSFDSLSVARIQGLTGLIVLLSVGAETH